VDTGGQRPERVGPGQTSRLWVVMPCNSLQFIKIQYSPFGDATDSVYVYCRSDCETRISAECVLCGDAAVACGGGER
jgi:hypothetical protein